jgi:glycosyltransferase involved in cell wall biosynthesis
VSEWLAQADVFALTSLYEGTSTALLEAMASGLAVVATDVGGTSRLVQDGVTGLLVPPQAPSRVAAALVRLLTDAELRLTLGENACRLVRSTFDITDCVHEYERLYETLLSARRVPPPTRSWTEAVGPSR